MLGCCAVTAEPEPNRTDENARAETSFFTAYPSATSVPRYDAGRMALLLTEADVRRFLPMSDLIDAMQAALAAFSTGKVQQPVRSVVELGSHGFFGVMPAAYALDAPDAMLGNASAGAKLVTVVPGNHDRGLPSHLATIVLLNAQTGGLEAIIDGRYITEARTAAVSAVSARHLARPDSRIVAIIGSGVQ